MNRCSQSTPSWLRLGVGVALFCAVFTTQSCDLDDEPAFAVRPSEQSVTTGGMAR